LDRHRQLGAPAVWQYPQQILVNIKAGVVLFGQHAYGGNAQSQVLDGVKAQVHHCVADGGDLFGQAVIRRIDNLENLDRDDRVFFDDLNQVFGGAIHIPCQFENFLNTFWKRRHAVNGI